MQSLLRSLLRMKRRSFNWITLSAVAAVLVSANACIHAMNIQAQNGKSVAAGTWGGEHMILEVSGKGADAEFDCAHGKITEPLTLDKQGHFDVAGTFAPEHGGPIRRDEPDTSAPARYTGHVEGETMSLTITVGKDETVGPFTLTRGSQPMLRKCR